MEGMQGSIRRNPASGINFAGVRRFPRTRLSVEVLVQDADGWEIPVESIDFSPVGMFVESEFLFEIGAVHNLIFQSPEGDELFSMRAQVVRVENEVGADTEEDDREIVPGMAYEFVGMDSEAKERLERLAARI